MKFFAQIVYRGIHPIIEGPFDDRLDALAVIKKAIPECHHPNDNFFLLIFQDGKLRAEHFHRTD